MRPTRRVVPTPVKSQPKARHGDGHDGREVADRQPGEDDLLQRGPEGGGGRRPVGVAPQAGQANEARRGHAGQSAQQGRFFLAAAVDPGEAHRFGDAAATVEEPHQPVKADGRAPVASSDGILNHEQRNAAQDDATGESVRSEAGPRLHPRLPGLLLHRDLEAPAPSYFVGTDASRRATKAGPRAASSTRLISIRCIAVSVP